MSKVFVIGGGAAGMMAAIAAADNGNEVHIFEKNEKLGKKLFITGKGRCNVTNASDINTHLKNLSTSSKFLYGAYNRFMYQDIMNLIESEGVLLKIERGNRVFPVSDKSSDVIKALTGALKKRDVKIHLNTAVTSIEISDDYNKGMIKVKMENKTDYCQSCIVATGGNSYKSTGSDGDGYRFAKKLGHTVTKLYPALVPLETEGDLCQRLQGLSLKNVRLSIFAQNEKIYDNLGEMLFTHFGISGPLVLTASSLLTDRLKGEKVIASLDLKPALTFEQLDKRILKDFNANINKMFKHSLDDLLPKKLIPVIIELSKIGEDKKVNEITKEERQGLVKLIKNLEINITRTRGFDEAIITKGGIELKEINPRTMESKLVPGLYFAGEVLDLDAFTGGFNLQIAWSTGYLSGNSIY